MATRWILSCTLTCLAAGCGPSESADYRKGFERGKTLVDERHQQYGTAGEFAMDLGDEFNYTPHDSEQSTDFNRGLRDGYWQARQDVDTRQHAAAGADNAARATEKLVGNSGVHIHK